jgi:hypothetical protein
MNYFYIEKLVNWIYGLVDRVRGIWRTRPIGFINPWMLVS